MTKHLVLDSVFVRDFSKLELLPSFLNLSYEMQTSSTACYSSELPGDSISFDGPVCSKIYVETLSNEELVKAFRLGFAFPGLAYEDYTVLYIAHRDGLEMVTGDSCVRKVAESMNIVVHNYLWAMIEMINAGIMDYNLATIKYYELETSVNRLAVREQSVKALQIAYSQSKKSA